MVHWEDFVITGADAELDFVLQLLSTFYDSKNRVRLGSGPNDVEEIHIPGCIVRLHDWGISWEADSRRREIVMEYFGLNGESKALSRSGYTEEATTEGQPRGAEELPGPGGESEVHRPG